jgi:hypothetical protein
VNRLAFYRGPAPVAPGFDPEPWSERWPCASMLCALVLLLLALAGAGAVGLWLDTLARVPR